MGARIRQHIRGIAGATAVVACLLLLWATEATALTGGSLAASDAHFSGETPNDFGGTSLAGAGDVDGDGFDDLLIGSPFNDSGPGNDGGAAYLVLGGPDGWGLEQRLTETSAVEYFGPVAGDQAGASVAGAGDVNDDGFDDLLVGAPTDSIAGAAAGAAYLVLGSANPTSGTLATHIKLIGEAPGDRAGTSVAGAGDVNGDGRDDFVVGAPVNADGGAGAGAAYLVLGSDTPTPGSLSSHIEYTGAAGDAAGTSVGGGDSSGDGLSDVIVGAPGSDSGGIDSGAAYIEPGSLTPASNPLDGVAPNVRLHGNPGDAAGSSVALGDVNGDGRADAVVGAPLSDAGGADSGAAYFVPMRPGMPSSLLSIAGVRLNGELAGDRAGTSIGVVGDVDGDGFGEFAVGAPLQGTVDRGAAYLVRGAPSPGGALGTHVRYEGQLNNDKAGTSVAGGGDANGDALADFLVGAPENDILFSNGGGAYLVFGPRPTPASPSYRTRVNLRDNAGDSLPARFDQARALVDFTAGALSGGSIDVTRHLFDPCDTSARAERPIWDIDANKVDPVSGSSLALTFKYTAAEIAAIEEGDLLVWRRPTGEPCGPWTPIPLADTQRDADHNRITATLSGVTSLGSFTLAPDSEPELSVSDVDVVEGDAGQAQANFDITLSKASADPVRVEARTENSSALATSDYVSRTAEIRFAPGELSKPFSVAVEGDVSFEPDEEFLVRLTAAEGATVVDDGVGTIQNDDPAPPGTPLTDPPETQITAGPNGITTNDETPVFEFSADESASFECRLDSDLEREFAPCSSPHPAGLVADGPHAFEVRAIDASGEVDPTPAVAEFSVATTGCRGQVATIVGTEGPDRITGTPGNDVIVTFAGDDRVTASGGDDRICSGGGEDILNAGLGEDQLSAGSGDDVVRGDEGADVLLGGGGEDIVNGEDGADQTVGGAGDDTVTGGAEADAIRGGSDDDSLNGGDGIDQLGGGSGEDTLSGDADDDELVGGSGEDLLSGAPGNDSLDGNSGDDVANGGTGTDELSGGSGDDRLNGETDDDALVGGGDDDRLDGGGGTDSCGGGSGENVFQACE